MYTYRAELVRCIDGDTAIFDVDLGFKVSIRIRGRLLKVDTPNRGKPDYEVATAALENLLELVKNDKGYVTIMTSKTGMYGRWLVDIEGVNDILAERWPYEKG
jgi:micrococcal nuclease|tara:strand:- start:1613 stop:1921 length:309 start_codon:yes stop_codon:yes gene_type:complete